MMTNKFSDGHRYPHQPNESLRTFSGEDNLPYMNSSIDLRQDDVSWVPIRPPP